MSFAARLDRFAGPARRAQDALIADLAPAHQWGRLRLRQALDSVGAFLGRCWRSRSWR
jgi:hypothetical protein